MDGYVLCPPTEFCGSPVVSLQPAHKTPPTPPTPKYYHSKPTAFLSPFLSPATTVLRVRHLATANPTTLSSCCKWAMNHSSSSEDSHCIYWDTRGGCGPGHTTYLSWRLCRHAPAGRRRSVPTMHKILKQTRSSLRAHQPRPARPPCEPT